MGESVSAAGSFGQLAQICKARGRLAEAEQWFRKALVAVRTAGDQPDLARTLSNLADLLEKDSARLNEARSLAEESLTIKETLDHTALAIWKTYNLLARIAAKQGETSQSAAYRAKSRQAYLAFPAWRQQIQKHEKLIASVIQDGDVEAALSSYDESAAAVKAAIRNLINGERDEAVLCEPLNYTEAAIIHAILEGFAEDA
jgi:tetratricopeptide (TPR) repeat protein